VRGREKVGEKKGTVVNAQKENAIRHGYSAKKNKQRRNHGLDSKESAGGGQNKSLQKGEY